MNSFCLWSAYLRSNEAFLSLVSLFSMKVVVVGSLGPCVSNKDYYSSILCLGARQRTPSSVAFYGMPEKIWAARIFFVPVRTQELFY